MPLLIMSISLVVDTITPTAGYMSYIAVQLNQYQKKMSNEIQSTAIELRLRMGRLLHLSNKILC